MREVELGPQGCQVRSKRKGLRQEPSGEAGLMAQGLRGHDDRMKFRCGSTKGSSRVSSERSFWSTWRSWGLGGKKS